MEKQTRKASKRQTVDLRLSHIIYRILVSKYFFAAIFREEYYTYDQRVVLFSSSLDTPINFYHPVPLKFNFDTEEFLLCAFS